MPASFKGLITQPAIISSLLVTALAVGLSKLGAIEGMELKAFDQMMQMHARPEPDSRILVVAVTEEDIGKQVWPLPVSDEVLDKLLRKLERYKPRAIGANISRDWAEPVNPKLLQHLQQNSRIVLACKRGDADNRATPPPKGIEPKQVGFNNIVKDSDGVVRRNILSASADPASLCATSQSLALQLALGYLAAAGIEQKTTSNGDLQLGNTVFKPLESDSGAYQGLNARGYQILLNYRPPNQVVQQVSIAEVLSDRVEPGLVKDRVVLIGETAPSLKDVFYTPFSSSQQETTQTAGIVLHAEMVSQILSTVIDGEPLFWFWPEWGEVLWIWGWSLAGGVLAWRIQHPLRLGVAGVGTLAALLGSGFFIFTQAGWVPVVAPLLGLVGAGGSVVATTVYLSKKGQAKIKDLVQEQEKTIALLRDVLKASGGASTAIATGDRAGSGTLLNNRYRITDSLGAGGFGHTYKAEDTQRPGNPQCVVKQLYPASNDEQFLAIARRLFKTEAEILELLGNHDRIPGLLADFEENQQFYLVQELIQGHPLNNELTPGTRLPEAQVVEDLKDVLNTLVFVHANYVIHRDIKPNNLIRREQDNRLVLIDFGAVKQIRPTQSEEAGQSIAIGTAGYAPPEQIMGLPRLNSDIYALGTIGIQALTGKPVKELQRDPLTGGVVWPDLAKPRQELAAVLDKMVSYDFNSRYQSAQEALKSLERL